MLLFGIFLSLVQLRYKVLSFRSPTAKISQMSVREAPMDLSDSACPRYLPSQLVLSSGKVIDTSGVPASLGKEVLERIIKIVDSNGKGYRMN